MRLPALYIPHGAGPCFFMAWTRGLKEANVQGGFKELARRKVPKVILGYQRQRR